jgi:hypothetical protein
MNGLTPPITSAHKGLTGLTPPVTSAHKGTGCALQRSATLGDDGPIGLVMVPTRELAIQVSTPSSGTQ